MLTLQDVKNVWDATLEEGATPHRTPNWDAVMDKAEQGRRTPVTGRLWFIEEHNTGYHGVLERWSFRIPGKDGTELAIWADLLPDMIVVEKKEQGDAA